ncbi:MAG TPA: glycosyltransferase family 4 protein [Cyclobacteriaceae bacterium]|nr:glycosyltransferase family 4 protein [Cyclobacteriaceae bacterium]
MSVKVLMLGWEYPPHIAGGLGIACHGLSESLHEEGVQITFVVPHLNGEEDASRIKLMSASDVNVTLASPKEEKYSSTHSGPGAKQTFETVAVESTLLPYDFAHLTEPMTSFQHWNNEILTSEKHSGTVSAPYKFKGGYGKELLEEVGRYSFVVEEIARNSNFDIIHAHDWMTYLAGLRASRATGKPLIIHVHATEFDRAGEGGSQAVYDIERMAVEQADHIVAVSNWTADILVSKYNADRSKIHVVHNGVFPNKADASRDSNPIGDKIVTFLGRVTFQKGPEYFVDAARKVLKEFPDSHFVMAGSGDALPQMIHRVARAGMSSNFHFTGFLKKKDIDRLLSFTNVYVMPSVSEPFGITPLEAIQAGVPVIISKQSGVSEVIPHALKVDFWDTDALARAVCSLLKHKSLASTMQKNAKESIKSISWNSAAKKIKRLYYETIHAES